MNKEVRNILEGELTAKDLRFGIICSRFNDLFVNQLLEGAVDCIVRHGGSVDTITVVWVPGAYEIPLAAHNLASSDRVQSIIALGVVIKGATAHADYINSFVSHKLGDIGIQTGIPIAYGIVTTDSIEQSLERSGSKAGNRGASAALTAIEMVNVLKKIA